MLSIKFVGLILVLVTITESFPDGGPVEGCIYETQPNHVGTESDKPDKLPYRFEATSGYYRPGTVIRGDDTS